MGQQKFVLGTQAKLYYAAKDLATAQDADWIELGNVRNVTLSLSKSDADLTTRKANGWKTSVAGLKEAAIEFDMVWDPTDAGFTAIQTAFMTDTPLAVMVLDGAKTVAGSQGLKADVMVMNFSREEPLEEALTAKVSIKPTYSATAPSWYTATGT